MKHEYLITGMTCQNCAATVGNALRKIPGVKNVIMSLETNTASIEMDNHIQVGVFQKALKDHPKYTITETGSDHQQPMPPEDVDDRYFFEIYKPIILVFLYLSGITVLVELTHSPFDWMRWMRNFMAGFFLIFSFFKLLDLSSFASSYSTYDVIAKRWYGWGFVYPFVEVALGVLFILNFNVLLTNAVTFFVMGISTIGVVQSLMQKRKIKCACLGAVFNLPMSTITLIEDLLMVVMAGWMIYYHV